MKRSDLGTANAIVKRLSAIEAIKNGRRDETRPPQFLVVSGNTSEWVPLSKAGADKVYQMLIAELDAEAAALRRRAAQISLSL